MRKRRCLPLRGKSASELARLILGVSRERAGRWGALPIRNSLAGAPGERKARSDSCRPRFETAVCAHNRPKRNESQPVCPLLVGQTGVNPEPTALEAGTAGPAGSARTRSRVQGRLSSKCNSLEEDIERRAPVEPLAGPVVDQIKDALKLRL